jgi:lipoprotein-anchoring transpeptidase ErfK/SrfK
MPLSRRTFVSGLVAAPALTSRLALGDDLFPINQKEATQVEYKYQMREMEFDTAEPAGTLVVDPHKCFLYHVLGGGMARRYGVAVGKSAHAWTGEVIIKKMAEWPVWKPAPYHLKVKPDLAKYLPDGMPGGLDNPLGARAMYLYKGEVDTVNRIHGGAKVEWIGHKATAGCISLLNVHIAHLYSNVALGTRVVMLG